jgi:hypothetical protein
MGRPIWALNSRMRSTGTPVRCESSHTVAPARTVALPTLSGCLNEAKAVRSGPTAALVAAWTTASAIPCRRPSNTSVAAFRRAGSPFASSSARL